MNYDRFIQIIKFIIVGVSAAFMHLTLLWLLVNLLSLKPIIANSIAFVAAFLVSYAGQSFWTFNHKRHKPTAAVRFLMIQLLCSYLLNQGLYTLLIVYTPLHYLIASFIVLATIPVLTFTLSKYWAFK